MSATPIEDMVVGLYDYIVANMETYLNAIEVEKADDVTLPDFLSRDYGFRDIFSMKRYPAILLAPVGVDPEASANNAENYYVDALAIMGLADNDITKLSKKQMRYADAFMRMVYADESIGGVCLLADIQAVDFYPAPPGQLSMCAIWILLRMFQEVIT